MTAPAPLSGGDARTQLAEVLDERLPDSMGRAECNALLDALLPVVERIADERAAEALRKVAKEFAARLPDGTGNGRAYNSYRVAAMLTDRAASLRAASRGEAGRRPCPHGCPGGHTEDEYYGGGCSARDQETFEGWGPGR